jgi:hypothetical protein
METNQSTPSRLLAYGSLALGSTTILATQADAATVVDVNSTTYNTGLSGIGTIAHNSNSGSEFGDPNKAYTDSYVTFSSAVATNGQFLRGSDTDSQARPSGSITTFQYGRSGWNGGPRNSAELNSSDNWFYVNAANDSTQRAWLQFHFGDASESGDFSIVKAVFLDEGDTIDNAYAASNVSAVPEPSHMAALFAMGASGILLSRRRQAA